MKVIAAKNVTQSAHQWLLNAGADIEQMHGLYIVFLPSNLVFWRSEMRECSHTISERSGIPGVYMEPGSDDERMIYTIDEDPSVV